MKQKILSSILFISIFMSIFLYNQTLAYDYDIDPSFSSSGFGLDGVAVFTALQPDGKIVVGGTFTRYQGVLTRLLIRFNADGSKDTGFNIGSGFNGTVLSVYAWSGGKVLVCGGFTGYNNEAATGVILLNSDGSRDTSFPGSGFNGTIRFTNIQHDGKLLIGGGFTSYRGISANGIIRLNSDWSRDTTFDIGSGFDEGLNFSLTQADGKIIIGGKFTTYQGVTANRLIRIYANGSRDTSFDVLDSFNEKVDTALLQPDGKIIVGGFFTGYQGISANGIIRLNSDGTRDTSFDMGNGFNATVTSVSLQPYGKILVGGGYTTYQGISANRLVRLNSDGSRDTTFDIGSGFDVTVRHINLQEDGKILLCGTFGTYKGISTTRITRLNGYSDVVILPSSTNATIIGNAFTKKGYTKIQEKFIGSKPISLGETNGNIPIPLRIENQNIVLSFSSGTQLKKANTTTNYNGIISTPTLTSISEINNQEVLSSFTIGNSGESIHLTGGIATISLPMSGQSLGSGVQVYYSEDNGSHRYPQTITWITENEGTPSISFTTNHFTDFAVTLFSGSFTGSFTINNDDVSTTSPNVTLNISTTPVVDQMRFSNDGISWSTRESYATNKSWTLSGINGLKTVYVEFDADDDNIPDLSTNDTINYNIGTMGSTTGNVRLEITAVSGTCVYGTSLYIGSHAAQFAAYDMTGGNFSSAFYCSDTEGINIWAMTMQASSDLSNGFQTIPAANVSMIASTNYVNIGACMTGTNDTSWRNIGTTPGIILNKQDVDGNICTIQSDTVNLAVHIPNNQAVGLYTGTLTLNMPF